MKDYVTFFWRSKWETTIAEGICSARVVFSLFIISLLSFSVYLEASNDQSKKAYLTYVGALIFFLIEFDL